MTVAWYATPMALAGGWLWWLTRRTHHIDHHRSRHPSRRHDG